MNTKKLINGVVKDFQVGDRVVWDKVGNSIYEVVKISGEGITISLLESHPQKGSIHSKAKRRVSLNEIEPLDVGSNDQQHAKSSRGFVIGDRIEHSTSSFFTKQQVYQELKKCSYNLTSVAGSAQVFPLQGLSLEALNSSGCANGMNTAAIFSPNALRLKSSTTLRSVTGKVGNENKISVSTSLPLHLPVSPLVCKENVKVQATSETASAQSLERSQVFSPNSSPLKMSQDSSPVPCTPAIPLGHISAIFSGRYSRAGTMHNGFVSVADTLERPSLESGYCWLESPNALSSTGKGRPPGQSRLEAQLKKLGVLESREVLNPQFLEKTYNLPLDWTNPQELKAATELLEQDAPPSATASIPELQVSPSVASSILIPSVNNYSSLVLGESNLYASLFPLELRSNVRERNKKVLGDFSYLAPVIPLELKQGQSLVQEKTNSYAFVLPLELKQERNLVLGDNQNNSVLEPQPTTRRKASGWLERYTKTKKLKGGAIATYPRVEGEREPNNSEHWYFAYRWEEKRDTAKSDNGYVTRAVSLPKSKVEAVQIAIARKWSQEKILSFIQGAEDDSKIIP
jgi:hypothetical protein